MAYNAVSQADALSDSASSRSASPNIHRETSSPPLSLKIGTSLRSARMSDASRGSYTPLQHPTPDLQALQGAYISNIERLEQSAERLSQSGSDIGEELRKLKLEQKKSESRRSSLYRQYEDDEAVSPPSRQFSYAYGSHASQSIVGTNSVARSGGFSPAGYFASPRGSIRSGSWSRRNSIRASSSSQGLRITQLANITDEHHAAESVEPPTAGDLVPTIPPPQPATNVLRITNNETSAVDNIETSAGPSMPLRQEHLNTDQRSASTNTFRQANQLFEDFDGVHIRPQSPELSPDHGLVGTTPEEMPVKKRLSSGRPISYLEPQPGENMVYYPAPVPMMLNLPQKLSRLPSASYRDKRKSQMLSDLQPEARKAAPWLPHPLGEEDEPPIPDLEPASPRREKRRTVTDLPPQLRASVFFDYPSIPQDIQMKNDSAVETLDSILDASAHAPVSAFTDHPIAGHVGPEVYGKAVGRNRTSTLPIELTENRKRRSSLNPLRRNSNSNMLEDDKPRNSSMLSLNTFGRRKSSMPLDENEVEAATHHSEDTPLQVQEDTLHLGGVEGEDEDQFHDAHESLAPEEGEDQRLPGDDGDFTGAPTTLLAELQLRKQQQKMRNRQAATAYPNGMHSTLLEMDAVAQVEKRSREKRHIQLAWEDPNAQLAGAEEDDEDVPLGMLYPTQKIKRFGRAEQEAPLGLIARRHMEDNESLAQRRARLRGVPYQTADSLANIYTHALPTTTALNDDQQPTDGPDEIEGETLAQRLKRLKNKKATTIPASRPVSGDFTSEMMSQFGGLPEEEKKKPSPTGPAPNIISPITNAGPENNPDDEPVEETLAQRRKRLQAQRQASNGTADPALAPAPAPNKRHSMASILAAHPAAGAGSHNNISNGNHHAPVTVRRSSEQRRQTSWARKVSAPSTTGMPPMASGIGVVNPMSIGLKNGGGEKGAGGGMDARKGDMIDRWRQSVLF